MLDHDSVLVIVCFSFLYPLCPHCFWIFGGFTVMCWCSMSLSWVQNKFPSGQ